jgi:hypothetical protein
MMSSESIYAYFGWDQSPHACGDSLNLLIHLIAYLSSWLLACYPVIVSLCGFTLVLHVLA